MTIRIETDRLVLTAPVIDDFDCSVVMHHGETMARYTGGKLLNREDVWRKLLQRMGHWTAFGYGVFTVRRSADNIFIGEVGLAHFCRGFGEAFDGFPEAAWMITAHAHGKGYAQEAVQEAHRWMTSRHAMRRSVCIIHPENVASLHVARNVGYEQTGEVHYRDATPLMFERFAS
ncbi:GNAT family N-acetyltransferase [Aureimonas fodinaquatilis]|uniref:GNAT family N-acetyltransferase n=1 Tax=Aureimonas fodinaquatilis TaxID=2565783 RepID=A0A5B0DZ70_9HYPH|nr:GNAT family N-acetyltransferase [Aureimonas fodinaquatilis]KAA0971833.1 GNAT family N-acetyltransferase [Aureimonas fodinaquatilis]